MGTEPLRLHVPAPDELWYRRKLMEDPETMSYNRGYDLDLDGYDSRTGCISFPRKDWPGWYACFVDQEPRRFYAYIVRESDGEFIGEVNVHSSGNDRRYEMGIVLEAKYRGSGYAEDALDLLLRHAFKELGAESVRNNFEETRIAALRTHLAAGFTECRRENGMVEVSITREQYFS